MQTAKPENNSHAVTKTTVPIASNGPDILRACAFSSNSPSSISMRVVTNSMNSSRKSSTTSTTLLAFPLITVRPPNPQQNAHSEGSAGTDRDDLQRPFGLPAANIGHPMSRDRPHGLQPPPRLAAKMIEPAASAPAHLRGVDGSLIGQLQQTKLGS